ncbi:MAG: carboxypeptidase regulatory-like domain-containing protein [Pyrinomonadaceae bacterium]
MKYLIGIITTVLLINTAIFAQQTRTVKGEVADSNGAFVVGAEVSLVDSEGNVKNTTTNSNGQFTLSGVKEGTYTLTVDAASFSPYTNTDFTVNSSTAPVKIVMTIGEISAEVDVSNDGKVDVDPANNASATVLKEDDINALPDDPDELEAALQALAGGGAGPNGGQIYIDGFQGSVPPKEAIREIRINNDPFSAEYERMGYGRIEILTKPGAMKWNGQASFNYNNDALNARNPYSVNKASRQQQSYNGYVSGPIIKNKASISMGVNFRDSADGAGVNASVLDSSYQIVPLQQEYKEPRRRLSLNPRLDYQLNDMNTLVFRYEYNRNTSQDFGGGFTLPSRGTDSTSNQHEFQITETAILNAKTVNETRFQFRNTSRDTTGDNTLPAVNVSEAFNGGGSSTGLSYDRSKFWELQNYTTTSLGKASNHAVRFGVQMRGSIDSNRSDSGYNGSFTFAGFIPTAATAYDLDGNGIISSIEQYRAKVLGATEWQYNPNQYSVTTGDPLAKVNQFEIGFFAKDDWNVRPGLTLSYGLRYENQTNINDNLNFAPRVSFAYSPGAGGASAPKDVFRGGFGIFYTRFNENYTMTAERLDGVRQRRYIIGLGNALLSQPVFTLDGVTNVPTIDQLQTLSPLSSTPYTIDPTAKAPYTMQGALSYERQLPGRTTFSVYYVFSRNLHMVMQRNVNAPVCPDVATCPVTNATALQALRPDPSTGNIYEYETAGYGNDQRLILGIQSMFKPGFMLMARYFLGSSKSNTGGGFPAYSYDLSDEYARNPGDSRSTFMLMSSFSLPYGISLRPFIIARSSSPFNITLGRDLNGDSIFAERPTFAQLSAACTANGLTNSWCDTSGYDPNAIIPKYFGNGYSYFSANLSLDKNFSWGGDSGNKTVVTGGGGMMGGRGRGGMFGGNERGKYNLSVGVYINNLLNHNNLGTPVGNVSSSNFGEVLNGTGGFGFRGGGGSGGGARTIEIRTRFRW